MFLGQHAAPDARVESAHDRADEPIQDPQTAITELRRTARACIHTWAACYSDIVHNLSGGLDSSIVLSCLKDAPSQPNISCLHYFGTGPDEDERKYARLMAGRVGIELIEHQLDVAGSAAGRDPESAPLGEAMVLHV